MSGASICADIVAKADNFDTNETIFGNRKHWLVIASSGMKRKHGFNIAGFTSGLYVNADFDTIEKALSNRKWLKKA